MFLPIYLDHNATTALNPKVLEAMSPFMSMQQGNATSRHTYGRIARDAIEQAREQVALSVGAQTNQVIFTASGTEANNLAITGIASNMHDMEMIVSEIEHPCVTRPAEAMQKRGWQLKKLAMNSLGNYDEDHLAAILNKRTGLLSVMFANNETGVLQNIAKLGEISRKHGAYMHSDAVQALGKTPINFSELNIEAMSISSHKIHGPQGAGALILHKRVDIQPILYGGGQERGLRSGSENVAAIVGFGKACEIATDQLSNYQTHTRQLREMLEQGLTQLGATIFGAQTHRLTNTSFFAFPNIEGETLVVALDKQGFAVASGSACSSNSTEPSHVLLAMGVAPDLARGAIRVSLDLDNTPSQISSLLMAIKTELTRLRSLAAIAA